MADPSPSAAESTECVRVVVRCRPLSSDEKKNNNQRVVTMDRDVGKVAVVNPAAAGEEPPKLFTYDTVFDSNSSQQLLYEDCARAIVDSVMEGYNGTIFAYGQTGTGKTYTMEGRSTEGEQGITPRSFQHIFDRVDASSATHLVRASFLEIYQDHIYDLLAPEVPKNDQRPKLSLHRHPDKGFYVPDLTVPVVKSAVELQDMLERGKKRRATAATDMNAGSSRSHCIFTVTVESSAKRADGQQHIWVGKLNLVDLAGSERQNKTGATGVRAKEGIKINVALSALGNVISALTKRAKGAHIPYRDSKLTMLLEDSLGGNTKTVMIANIGPADYNFDETISTLRFAARAKYIKNKPTINEDPKDAMLRNLQSEIEMLRAQLEQQEKALVAGPDFLAGGSGGGGQLPALQPTVVERVVEKVVQKGVSREHVEEMKKRAEEERRAVEEAAQRSIEESKAIKQRSQQAAEALRNEVKAKEMTLAQRRQTKQQLVSKLQAMENQILMGKHIMSEAERQAKELEQKQVELQARTLELERQQRLKRQRQEAQEITAERVQHQEQEVAAKTKKLEKLRLKYKQIKQEIEDVQALNQREREDMLDTIRGLTRAIQLKDAIIRAFVPFEEHDKVERRAQWDSEQGHWTMGPMNTKALSAIPRPLTARPVSGDGFVRPECDFARVAAAMGDTNPRFRTINIIEPKLHMPERTTQDYKLAEEGDEYDQDQLYDDMYADPEYMYAGGPAPDDADLGGPVHFRGGY